MADHSAIEWTDATWNPVRGCVKVSSGCAHCYAETFAERFRGVKGHPYEQGFDLRLVPEQLAKPLSWKKPRRVFVNSMSDLFQDGVPDSYIDQVFAVMALAPQHTFQVLTKRPSRMRAYLAEAADADDITIAAYEIAGKDFDFFRSEQIPMPLPNVWLGVSVENQHCADERIPLLLQTPAAVRFLSCEPLLEPVGIPTIYLQAHDSVHADGSRTPYLHWVIVGGESGSHGRPFDIAWARSLVAQCRTARVPVFVKQLGSRPFGVYVTDKNGVFIGGAELPGIHDRKGGDLTEWPDDLRVREWPTR